MQITHNQKTSLAKLLEKARVDDGILGVVLFGSAARMDLNSTSDIDVCLVMMPLHISAKRKSAAQLRLEYMKEFSFDIQVFQKLPLYVRRRVLREGRILFNRDERLFYELARRTAQAFEDFKHIYHDYLKEIELSGS